MTMLGNREELNAYIDDLVFNRQAHEKDEPLQVAGALIYAIQTREFFNENFAYYLKNISYAEKKQIKKIIDFYMKTATESQKGLFKKLTDGLPKDRVAKQNEERRLQEKIVQMESDEDFLKNVGNVMDELKVKLGNELRKTVVSMDKVKEHLDKIAELQARLRKLSESSPKARRIAINVLDDPQKIQDRLTEIDNFREQMMSENITPEELNKIQDRLSSNKYGCNHVGVVRDQAKEVHKELLEIRQAKLDKEIQALGENPSTLALLNAHKKWDNRARYVNEKFGDLKPEYIREGFYVMHTPMSEGEKNDIKMHVNIAPEQAAIAMDIITQMAKDEKYENLLHEFKIGDIEYIQDRVAKNNQIVNEKLIALFQGNENINIPALIKELKESSDKEAVMKNCVAQLPEEKRESALQALRAIVGSELGAVISGERILNEALFTIYFHKDMQGEKLKEFTEELSKKLQEHGVQPKAPEQFAKTDIPINGYCGITIDHVMENGKKIYLEGDNPKHVQMRNKALQSNPLTREIMPKTLLVSEHVMKLEKMALHEDPKDSNGMSAFAVKGLSEMDLSERVAFAGLLVSERFKQTGNVNLVYRNPDMFSKWVVKEIFNQLDFPVKISEKIEFFKLVEKATGTPPDEQAKTEIKSLFTDIKPENKEMIVKMLLPFYHDYLNTVLSEFDKNYKNDEKLPKDEQRQQYYQARQDRLNEAKKQFLGHVSFPFVESLVFELQEKDDFSPNRKAKLAQGFRSLREQGVMDSLLHSLDEANQGYTPQTVSSQIIEKAFTAFEKGKKEYDEVWKKHHREKMVPVEQRATELYKIVNKIASSFPDGSEEKARFERIAGSIENIKTELDHKLLRGEVITDEDVSHVQALLTTMMQSVKQSINLTDQRGESLLHQAIRDGKKDLVEALLKAGADPRIETTHYSRGVFGALKEAFTGKGKFFDNLTKPSPISAIEFARKQGNGEIIQLLQEREKELNTGNTEDQLMVEQLEVVLDLGKKEEVVILGQEGAKPPLVQDFQQKREPKQPEPTPFVAGWVRKIEEELVKLGQGTYTSKQNNAAIYALERIKNYMNNHPEIGPLNDKLSSIIGAIRNEALYHFPQSVISIINEIDKGNLAIEKQPLQNLVGDKTPFIQQWEAKIEEMKQQVKVSDYLWNSVTDLLKNNPAASEENLGRLPTVLARIKTEAGDTAPPEFKQMLKAISEGKSPDQMREEQQRKYK